MLTFQQAFIAEPEITPVNFGASDPFQIIFTIKNTTVFFTMYETQALAKPGPMRINTADPHPNLTEEIRPLTFGPCAKLLNYRDFRIVDNPLIPFRDFGALRTEATFPTGYEDVGAIRSVFGVAVSYKIRPWGLFTLAQRYACREFEAARDSDNRTHMLPYKLSGEHRSTTEDEGVRREAK